jgi:hypothetical protein
MPSLYCERVGPGLFAEPLNAVTNIAFLFAAWAAWSLARRRARSALADIWMLIALSIVIGIGSSLFHVFATAWARILDELPILLFQLLYLWLYMRRIMAQTPAIAAASIAGYLAVAYLGRQFPLLLNGSLVYAPALMLLLGLGLYHFLQHKVERYLMLAATGVFVISFVLRSIDKAACPYIPIGTHFWWHILNGIVLYLSMRALILNLSREAVR